MSQTQVLLDNSFFIFKCIPSKNPKNPGFSFLTTKERGVNILKYYFDLVKRICATKNFYDEFETKENSHEISEDKVEKIAKLYKNKFDYNDENIDKNIVSAPIYQLRLYDRGCRLFYIKSHEKNLLVIKPLFLDINHFIYEDKKFDKNFDYCFVCHNTVCKGKNKRK